jgi:hypothetical protein
MLEDSMTEWLLVAGIAAVPALAIVFVIQRTLPRLVSGDRRLAVRLGATYVTIVVLTRISASVAARSMLTSSAAWAFSGVSQVVTDVLGIAVSLVVIRTLWPQLLGRPRPPLTPLSRDAIHKHVKEILDSDSFITALNESLPRGERDAEFGLDSVPYLLQSVRLRRQRLESSTRTFLRLTIAAASATAIVISFFAWVLVNDESVGAPRALRSLRENVDSLAASLRYLNSDYRSTKEFAALTKAIDARADPASNAAKTKLQQILQRALKGTSLDETQSALRTAMEEVPFDTTSTSGYWDSVQSAVNEMERQNTQRRAAFDRVGQLQPRVLTLIDRVSEQLGKDQNRVAEVIRRIALGVIVSTFFLAIVRFVANLYRAEYNQLLRAHFDDMLVRSFYVTFKASEGLGNQRAAVLSSYITSLSALTPPKAAEEDKGVSKEDSDLLKVILSAAAKKL